MPCGQQEAAATGVTNLKQQPFPAVVQMTELMAGCLWPPTVGSLPPPGSSTALQRKCRTTAQQDHLLPREQARWDCHVDACHIYMLYIFMNSNIYIYIYLLVNTIKWNCTISHVSVVVWGQSVVNLEEHPGKQVVGKGEGHAIVIVVVGFKVQLIPQHNQKPALTLSEFNMGHRKLESRKKMKLSPGNHHVEHFGIYPFKLIYI